MDDAVRIAFASGLPYAGLRDHRPDERLLAAIPTVRRLGLLPLALHGHHLTLATPTPTPNLGDLPTHFHITLVISPADEITTALARATPPEARPHWNTARPEAPPRARPETPWHAPAARPETPPPHATSRAETPPQSAPRPDMSLPPRDAPRAEEPPHRSATRAEAPPRSAGRPEAPPLQSAAHTEATPPHAAGRAETPSLQSAARPEATPPRDAPRAEEAPRRSAPWGEASPPHATSRAEAPPQSAARVEASPPPRDGRVGAPPPEPAAAAEPAARAEEAPPEPATRAEEAPPEPVARAEEAPPRPASRRDDIARRLGLAVVDHLQPDPAALARLDDTAQRRLGGVPLALDGDVLYVAIADRFGNYQPETGGGHVRYVVADGGALDELLGVLHGSTWAEMAADSEPKRAKPAAPARRRGAAPPTTSLLLPLTGGVGATVHAATTLASLDHPVERLEVLLLVAAQDAIGARAAHALADGPGHRVITLPPQLPRDDRDAALHYGLLLARGEHVAVLDPGDIPAPGLLTAADHALAAPDVAAAQARLDPPAPSQRGPAWHRHAPLAHTGVVVRRDVAEDLGGFRRLDRRLRRAGLRIAPLPETVATAGERS